MAIIGSILGFCGSGPKNLKKKQNFKFIISWFPLKYIPNRPRGIRKSSTRDSRIYCNCNCHFDNPIAPISLHKQVLELADTYKYLGIRLNSQLNWDKQWVNVRSKIRSLTFLLKKLKRLGFKEFILKTIYQSLGLSHFTTAHLS